MEPQCRRGRKVLLLLHGREHVDVVERAEKGLRLYGALEYPSTLELAARHKPTRPAREHDLRCRLLQHDAVIVLLQLAQESLAPGEPQGECALREHASVAHDDEARCNDRGGGLPLDALARVAAGADEMRFGPAPFASGPFLDHDGRRHEDQSHPPFGEGRQPSAEATREAAMDHVPEALVHRPKLALALLDAGLPRPPSRRRAPMRKRAHAPLEQLQHAIVLVHRPAPAREALSLAALAERS